MLFTRGAPHSGQVTVLLLSTIGCIACSFLLMNILQLGGAHTTFARFSAEDLGQNAGNTEQSQANAGRDLCHTNNATKSGMHGVSYAEMANGEL